MEKKAIVTLIGVVISDMIGGLLPVIGLLTFLMILDYISGMLAAKKEAIDHPRNRNYGWSSKKGVLGIYKKIGYITTIAVAICTDYLIYKFANELGMSNNSHTFFSLLVAIWFILNEAISILENVGRMGVTLPRFFRNVLFSLRNQIDNKDADDNKEI